MLLHQLASLIVDGFLWATHKAAQRLNDLLLGVEQGIRGAGQVGKEPTGVFASDLLEGGHHAIQHAEEPVLDFLPVQVGQFDLQLFDGIDGFSRQSASFVATGRAVEKIGKKLFEMADLGGAELNLWL
ncbi:hypothetical protein D3C75_944570 [compost metagenome]